ncbi:helix-turn-helix domain-containing protein [Thalassospira sp.]|uniref:helix-turn-helix domain-containing protein n=1 Tax=Thalassospira sp. TaxID=1912094 RepID=UPI003AA7C52D
MARAALNWNLEKLAFESGVSRNTISRFESGLPSNRPTVSALQTAMENAGVIFIAENGEGAGVRLKKQ